MSDQRLRDGIAELADDWRSQPHDPDSIAVTVMRHCGAQLAGLLSAHPAAPAPVVTDEAVEAAAMAVSLDWENYTASMRTALTAAAPRLGPRPLLDREAVSEALFAKWLELSGLRTVAAPVEHCHVFADAVMELAQPMPTREVIAQAIHDQYSNHPWKSDRCLESARNIRLRQADAVLALLNGAES